MKPDIRYYLQISRVNDPGAADVDLGAQRLIGKTRRKYPATIVWYDKIAISDTCVDAAGNLWDNSGSTAQWQEISGRLGSLGDGSELVVLGHADAETNTLSGVSPIVLANALVDLGFAANCRINLTGDNLGRNAAIDGPTRRDATASELGAGSFADRFQQELLTRGRRNCIHARTSAVTVTNDGRKLTSDFENEAEQIHKQPGSKIVFGIDAQGTRTMAFAY